MFGYKVAWHISGGSLAWAMAKFTWKLTWMFTRPMLLIGGGSLYLMMGGRRKLF